jgi:hypothetical protein
LNRWESSGLTTCCGRLGAPMHWQTWEQEILARREQRGALRARRTNLHALLEDRFGPLLELATRQIEAIDDPEPLLSLLRQALRVPSVQELDF